MTGGYVKLYRQLLDNPIVCKDGDHLAIWIYLLLNVTHKEMDAVFKGKRITLQPGQLLTGRKSISEKMCVSESKVKRVLTSFEIDQQIDRQRSNKNSLITVKNWYKYQCDDQQNDQRVTSNRPASDQQVTTNKNVKNDKKDKNERIYSALDQAIDNFKEHRKKLRKPMTDHAVDLLVKKLGELANTDEEKIKLVEYAIERGWQSVFPISDKQQKPVRQRESFERPTQNYDHLAVDPFAEEGEKQ